MKKKIAILGSTGSIGRQTLEVVDRFPQLFEVAALAAGSNTGLLAEQVRKYKPRLVAIAREELMADLRDQLQNIKVEITGGLDGLTQVATVQEASLVVTSVTGAVGLIPTVEAIKQGKDIALANKETLVAAGELVTALAREKGVRLLPVDSEHSAIFQCLQGAPEKGLDKLILTASGGPFRGKKTADLAGVTREMALNHPNWAMGAKITVDSASMMNKGLEVIEARWLFDKGFEDIEVLVHPQSIIHSMVRFADGSILAQLGLPDMRLPIQYALSYPERWENDFPRLDFIKAGQFTFEEPDLETFACLRLAFEAGKRGGTLPAVMNAANEIAVALFLEGTIKFLQIPELIERVMGDHNIIDKPSLEEILEADREARIRAKKFA